ncbi:MAG: twitching motility protein PilT [Methanobacteriota archaeon]|nr:MAG: twitching motility protein PilT [Euryarchaeota archaeon]
MASRIVLLDTNALLMPFQFRVNLETELGRLMGSADLAIPSPVWTELEFLAERDRDARAALQLAARYRVIEAPGSADDALLALASSLRAVVVTNDQPLLDRLRAASIPRIFLRSRNHLVAEGL